MSGPTTEPRELLALRGVSVRYGARTAVRGVDLRVRAGEVVCIVGPNGAGKTSTLRAALGLLRPAAGTVHLLGGAPRRARHRVGYIPQRHEVDWSFPASARDVVTTGRLPLTGLLGRVRPEDRLAVDRALERCALTGMADRPVSDLSGGQRQRVLIARALSLDPELLVLDEPYTGVDVPTQDALTDLLLELAGEGVGIVMSTHDLPAAAAVADRLCVVDGAVVVDAEPAVAVRHPGFRAVFGERVTSYVQAVGDLPTRQQQQQKELADVTP